MEIPYIGNDVSDTIEMLVDPDENMAKLVKLGEVTKNDNYAEACYNMCNISTAVIGTQLNEFCEPGSLMVHEGVFGMMGNHTWIEIDGVIVDATLMQFVPTAKKLCIIDKDFKEYHSIKQYTFEDWLKNSPNIN